jgi:hypothetical protein
MQTSSRLISRIDELKCEIFDEFYTKIQESIPVKESE